MKLKLNATKVMYFQNKKREPAVCLAFEITEYFQKAGEYSVSCAWSVKHSEDRPNRRTASKVAIGRLGGTKSAIKFQTTNDEFFTVLREVAQQILASEPVFDQKALDETNARLKEAGYSLDGSPKKYPSELKRALRQILQPRKSPEGDSTNPV